MVSHPETGSDSPIGSDWDRGRDNYRSEVFRTCPGKLGHDCIAF